MLNPLRPVRLASVGVIALASLPGTAFCRAALAAEPPVPSITVTGEAEAEVPPDTAVLTLGVAAEQRTAAGAADTIAGKAKAMMAVLQDAGVEPRDVRTTALSLDPLYPEDANGRRTGVSPRAFAASTTYRVRVRPAERAGELVSKLVERGANTVDGIDYDLADRTARLDTLRAEAARDAKRKATLYVEALDQHLGVLNEINPGQDAVPPPPPMAMRAAPAMAKVAALPAAPGLITLRASVTVRWLIAP